MILSNSPDNDAILSNVGATSAFTIKATAKSFQILSSGLYSNKIKAIVRELSTNALDSHIGAGKADIPFEVHLPTFLEPWFAVRDFGLGLSQDEVVDIYGSYFTSTKTDSNDFIGALGLGSKSPFSYTENFTVTAIKNGTKRIYSAFINEVGVPSIAEMTKELTDEGNGVEVKFSVTDRYDYTSFRNEASSVFQWFSLKPDVIGDSTFEHRDVQYKEKDIVPGVHVRADSDRACIAVMGNIAYPLGNIPEAEKHFGELAQLLQCGLVLQFEIGELDFAASREQLSYIPLTINSIRSKLEQLNANLATHLAKSADQITGEWEKAIFLYERYNTRLYMAAVNKYVADTKFELFDPNNRGGLKSFYLQPAELTKKSLDVKGFSTGYRSSSTITPISRNIDGKYVPAMTVDVSKNVIIVLNDLKTGCVARARYHYNNNGSRYQTVFCLSHSSTDLEERQKAYDEVIKDLHYPPTVVKASTLDMKPRAKPVSTTGITTLGLKQHKRRGYYTWQPFDGSIDENETYYYVTLSGHEPIGQDGGSINICKIRSLMDGCGIEGISNIEIFGVRKNRIKEIKELENWVWIEDKLREETAKISDEHIALLIARDMLDLYHNRVYTNATVAKMVGVDSEYAKYVKLNAGIKRATGNVTELVELCGKYGKSIQVDTVRNKLQSAKDALYKKYPLLRYFRDGATDVRESEMAGYIKMVDANQ